MRILRIIKATFFLLIGFLSFPINVVKHYRLSRKYDQEIRSKYIRGKAHFDDPCDQRLIQPREFVKPLNHNFYGKTSTS